MKTRFKRIIASLLTTTMLTASLAACGGGDAPAASADPAAIEPTPTTGVVNEYGWEMPKETINISYYYAQQTSPTEDAKYTKQLHDYILEKFNVNLEKICYDTDANERLNLMIASDDYPDMMIYMNATQIQDWIEAGKVLPTEDLMKKFAPEYYEQFKDYIPRMKADDGNLYKLAVCWGNMTPENTIPLADTAPAIRYDWYNEIGAPDISTPDGFYNALKEMVAKHPTSPQGNKTYATSFYDTKSVSSVVPSHLSWWGGMFGLKQGMDINDETNEVKYWINSDKGTKVVSYLNRFYREGLMDPDGFTIPLEQWSEKAIDERYAAFVGPFWIPGFYATDHWFKLKGADYPSDMRYANYDVKDPEVPHSTYNPKNTSGNGFIIMTDKCRNPADTMRWLNFENSTLGTKLVGYGIPNLPDSVWTLDDKGNYAFVPEKVEQITSEVPTFDFEKFLLVGGDNALQISSSINMMEDGSNCWFNQSNKDKWKKMKDENLKDSMYDNTAMATITVPAEDPVTTIKQRCADILMTAFAKAVSAPTEEECLAILDKARADVNGAGMLDVEKFYTDAYKANLEKYAKG